PYAYPHPYGAPPTAGAPGPGMQPLGMPAPGMPAPLGYPAPYGWPAAPPSNGMGTSAMITGILGALGFCFWPIAFILGVLGVVLGTIGRRKAARGEATNGGQALAGIICGVTGILLSVGMGVLTFMA
ncbi:MAG TPA: DUF4190 domain-containing protein, partial [Streptomyces sp.]